MSTTREEPCQLALNFDAPAVPLTRGSGEGPSNVVQVFFGSRPHAPRANPEIDHQAIIRQVLLNAKMLSW